jgi:hypothetical protein
MEAADPGGGPLRALRGAAGVRVPLHRGVRGGGGAGQRRRGHGTAVQVDPMKPILKAPRTERLEL